MDREILQYIKANQLSSVMNKTKWKELANSMTSNNNFEPQVWLKYLLDKEPMPGFTFLDWEWVKNDDISNIEWMEIDPVKKEHQGSLINDKETNYSAFIEHELKRHNIPFSVENGNFKIWGYTWPNEQPNFV